MRGERSLYALHLGVAFVAIGLMGAAAGTVLLASDFSIPSAGEVSRACADWLSAGGPGAVLGLLVLALAGTSVFVGMRSALRQVQRGRTYLARLPLGPTVTLDGIACRRVEVTEPVAFCTGYLRPQIYVSRGLIDELSAVELRAVIAHERHHLHRHDPLRRLMARALADALFLIPILRRSSERYVALGELAADRAAVAASGGRRPLAAALLKFSDRDAAPAPAAGIAPERVDHLLGDPKAGRWRLSRAIVGLSTLVILMLAGIMSVTKFVQAGVDWPLLLAAGCMTGMVFGPLVLGATAVVVSRRAMRARRS